MCVKQGNTLVHDHLLFPEYLALTECCLQSTTGLWFRYEHLAQMCRRGKANTINSHWWFYDAIHKMQVVGGGSFLMVLIG